ncbi:MAG TPA: hypothetical protein VF546_13860 [Pyrinomonadaceae bacterium]|jgi:hypothetical protein
MLSPALTRRPRRAITGLLTLLLLASGVPTNLLAQTPTATQPTPATTNADAPAPALTNAPATTDAPAPAHPGFRLERVPVAGGAELLTVFGELPGAAADARAHDETSAGNSSSDTNEVPLVTILRDTLGDETRENDRLRYVWMHTYTRPGATQRAAAAVPFLYNRVGNKGATSAVPPPVVDLAGTGRDVWQKLFWSALQTLLIDPYGFVLKAPTRTYRRNVSDYRKAHVIRALAILALYEAEADHDPVFSPGELNDIQARLMLTQQTFGGILDDVYLQRVYQQQTTMWRDARGHNWELLRQQAEADNLVFEPLVLPDGSATHALVWVAREDLETNNTRKYHGRFLNIAAPWGDKRLRRWQGYTETRYYDAENRACAPEAPGARAVELIPLALYGLDHPKIPILLVDFRAALNPKQRELSKRVLEDVARNVLALSRFDLPYFVGRTVYDYVTDKRGIDLNQNSRLRAYTQLKLLLSLDTSLDPELRTEVSRRLEYVSLNPLENDRGTEVALARAQYAALLDYAARPAGLPARLDRDRRAEMVPLKHTRTEQALLRVANLLSFGLYTHREDAPPAEQLATLDPARQLAYHRRFLREVARASARVEVQWDTALVRRSLAYVAEHGAAADGKTASAVARIFAHTEDEELRRLCLSGLYRINNETAKAALARVYRDAPDERWRALSADYLIRAAREEQRIAPATAKIIATIGGGQ